MALGSIVAASVVAGSVAAGAEPPRDPRQVLNRAKAEAGSIPGQADALARLAWPADGRSDPLVQAAAREELVGFGDYALPALRKAVKQADPRYRADVTAALIEARRTQRFGDPPDYIPGLEEALWFGSIEARRLAMIELSRYQYPPAVLTIIDAIHLNSELTWTGLRALGRMRDERARHFLRRVLDHGEPRYRRLAAQALGRLGDMGVAWLREGLASEDRGVREAAMAAFLLYAAQDDAAMLREYAARHADDDPELLDRVRDRTYELETLPGGRPFSDAADPSPETAPER
jgi:HEAT repeat protein